jgi:hypothetical protein
MAIRRVTGSQWHRVVLSVLALFGALRYAMPSSERFDLPIQTISAMRAMSEAPYRDFNALYGPAGHLLQGAFLRVMAWAGPIAASRLYFALQAAVGVLLFVWVLRRVEPAWRTLAAAVVGPGIIVFACYSGLAMNLLLAGLVAAEAAGDVERSAARRVAAGVALAALAVLGIFVRLNFGLYAALAGTVALAARIRRADPAAARVFAAYAVAGVTLTALVLAVFAAAGALQPYVAQTAGYLARVGRRTPPWGSQALFAPALAATVVLQAVALAALGLGAARRSAGAAYAGALLLPLLSYLFLRFDGHHLYPLLVLFVVIGLVATPERPPLRAAVAAALIGAAVGLASGTQPGPMVLGAVFGGLAAAVMAGAGAPRMALVQAVPLVAAVALSSALSASHVRPVWRFAFNASTYARNPEVYGARPVRAGFLLAPDEAALVDELRRQGIRDGEWFLAAAPGTCGCSNDVCVNTALYLAAGALPSVRYWIFDPPTTAFPDVQERIVEDLERTHPRLVVLQRLREATSCPGSEGHLEASVLYDYLERRYRRADPRTVTANLEIYVPRG